MTGSPGEPGQVERVVLLDEDGRAIGTAPKSEVHHRRTPLHLAFSCYVFDDTGRLLLTQRALDKRTWPGVWTNSLCGHPGPGEDLETAVRRRAQQELGAELTDVALVLPAFRYRAEMADGTVENEMCPVFTARLAGGLDPDPAEVADTAWVEWSGFRDEVGAGARDVSPWCALQVAALAPRESEDGFQRADPAGLPPACR